MAPGSSESQTPVRFRFLRFLLVGGLNTLFGFFAYSLLILGEAPTWLALVLGNTAGMMFNFFSVGRLVFGMLDRTRLFRFALCYLFILALNLTLIDWTILLLHDRILAQAVLVLPVAALSYFLTSRFVFVSGRV